MHDGPVSGRGLYFLYPNVIPYTRAGYTLPSTRVDVYYTESAISVEQSWDSYQCPGRSLLDFTFRGERIFYLPTSNDYSLFFVPAAMPPDFCGFLRQFMADFTYFREALDSSEAVPFPAVLGIRPGN